MVTYYIDANVFIFAALSDDKKAQTAKEIIKKAILGEITAITSCLTIDEVIWKIWKETKDRNIAIEEGLKILQFDNLEIVGIDAKIMKTAVSMMKIYKTLKPRDAIHAATAQSNSASILVSDDPDFDVLTEIKRKALE